jgi:hypothetical protein
VNHLLKFLYGESQIREELSGIGPDLARLLEAADSVEHDTLKHSKVELRTALKELGIEGEIKEDPAGGCLCLDDGEGYAHVLRVLAEPSAIHRLAELGWVAEKVGDAAMTNEPAHYRVKFLEIDLADTTSSEPAMTHAKTMAFTKKENEQARAFASTPMDREAPAIKAGGKTTGVGKATSGEAPEGKPKGSVRDNLSKGMTAAQIAARLLEDDFVTCGNCSHRFDYDEEPGWDKDEVKCPKCGKSLDSAGRVRNLEARQWIDLTVAHILEGYQERFGVEINEDDIPEFDRGPYRKEELPGALDAVLKAIHETTTTGGVGTIDGGPMGLAAPPVTQPPKRRRLRAFKKKTEPEPEKE